MRPLHSPVAPVVALLVSLLLAACRDAGPGAVPTSPVATATVAATPVAPIAFPRQSPPEGEQATMAATLTGTLAVRDGCLWVDPVTPGGPALPVWPAGFRLEADGAVSNVHDGQGTRVAVGDEVFLSGGYVDVTDPGILAQIPEACRGEVFMVGDTFRPNLVPDSDLYRAEVLEAGDHAALALAYTPRWLSMVAETATMTGTLVHYDGQRCIQLQTGDGPGPVTLLWPPAWQVTAEGDRVTILDATGTGPVAREGDVVSLEGRPVRQDWESALYRRAVSELPGDCCCTFFLVEAAH